MNNLSKIFCFFVLLFCFINSCKKIETLAPEPEIEFISFDYKDTIDILGNKILEGTLKFSFVDGDGDIGFGIDSTSKKTVFLKKYKIKNNSPELIEQNEDLSGYKIPEFSTSGNRKFLKGEIVVNNLDELPPFNIEDTLMYDFYIIDRAGHISNTEKTGYLILKDFIH